MADDVSCYVAATLLLFIGQVEQLGSAMWLVIIGSLIVTGSTLKSSIKVASFLSQIIVLT